MDGARDYETTVYHPIGFLLIVFESGQPMAHLMKAAVAEFVWHFAGPRKLSPRERDAQMKHRRETLKLLATTRDAFVQQALITDLQRISLDLGHPVPDLTLIGTDAKQLKLQGV